MATSAVREAPATASERRSDDDVLTQHGYKMGAKLGQGTYGTVFGAVKSATNDGVAIKIIDGANVSPRYLTEYLPKEIAIWKDLMHRNIVAYQESFEENGKFYLVQDLAPGGNLAEHLKKIGGTAADADVKRWLTDVLAALDYMHKNGSAHRDIKAENVLFAADGRLLISDFGFAKRISATGDLSQVGSLAYMSPQLLQGKQYKANKADSWAIGVLAHLLLTGKLPFRGGVNSMLEQMGKFVSPPTLSPSAGQFIKVALTMDEGGRGAANDLLDHAYLKG